MAISFTELKFDLEPKYEYFFPSPKYEATNTSIYCKLKPKLFHLLHVSLIILSLNLYKYCIITITLEYYSLNNQQNTCTTRILLRTV